MVFDGFAGNTGKVIDLFYIPATTGGTVTRALKMVRRAFAPRLEARIEPAEAGLFDLYDLDEAVSALAEPRVPLPARRRRCRQ